MVTGGHGMEDEVGFIRFFSVAYLQELARFGSSYQPVDRTYTPDEPTSIRETFLDLIGGDAML